MKNIKLISLVCVVLVALLGVRLLLGLLEQQPEDAVLTSVENLASPLHTGGVLPTGDWAKVEKNEAEPQNAITASNVGSAEWKEQVKTLGHDPEKNLMQEQANTKPLEKTDPQTPEQLFPGVADLLNDKLPEGYDGAQRQQDLARFVQSVDPSVAEIETSLKSLASYGLSEAKQQAYQRLGTEKIAALQKLKQQALALDASLLDVVVPPEQ